MLPYMIHSGLTETIGFEYSDKVFWNGQLSENQTLKICLHFVFYITSRLVDSCISTGMKTRCIKCRKTFI